MSRELLFNKEFQDCVAYFAEVIENKFNCQVAFVKVGLVVEDHNASLNFYYIQEEEEC